MVMHSLLFASRNQMMLLKPNRISTILTLKVWGFRSTTMKSKRSERYRLKEQEIKLIGTNIKRSKLVASSGMILLTNLILLRCFRVCKLLSNTMNKLTIRWIKLNDKWNKNKETELKVLLLVEAIKADIVSLASKDSNICKVDKTKIKVCLQLKDTCPLKWCPACLQ